MTICYDPCEHTAQYDIQNALRGKKKQTKNPNDFNTKKEE